ncbi:hypothetical protein ACTWQR_52475 [Streptomyces sp. 2A115]
MGTSRYLLAGPNTNMAEALVPLAERNQAGDWNADSNLADDVYNRPEGTSDISRKDPFDAVPVRRGNRALNVQVRARFLSG